MRLELKMKLIDMSKCKYCDIEGAPLISVGGISLCHDCEKIERTTDWDAFEQAKRERIAEANEY